MLTSYHCLNHPQARQNKVSDESIFESTIHQKSIERLPLYLLQISDSIYHRDVKNVSNQGRDLNIKYDINELEFRKDEFRNGTTTKNGASNYIWGLLHEHPLLREKV